MGNVEGFPDRWANPNDREYLPHLILASGVDKNGRLSLLNPDEDFLIMAPGYDISVAGVSSEEGIVQESGASLGEWRSFSCQEHDSQTLTGWTIISGPPCCQHHCVLESLARPGLGSGRPAKRQDAGGVYAANDSRKA